MSISFPENSRGARVAPSAFRSSKLHVDLVDVAPAPALPGLERGDDRMPGLLEVLGGVLVLRVVARCEAFLAAVGVGCGCLHGIQMSASGRHRSTSPFIDEAASRMLSPRGRPACTAGEPGTYSAAANPEEQRMTKGRLEAFSDGVIAVIITIMVLELKAPHDADPEALMPLIPVFLSYVLSFVFVGIYWNNHHHMFHAVHHVNGATLRS